MTRAPHSSVPDEVVVLHYMWPRESILLVCQLQVLQLAPDNSNLQGKSTKVRVIESNIGKKMTRRENEFTSS